MIKLVYIAVVTLWIEAPSNEWSEDKVFIPTPERAFVVESPQECAINLWKMNKEAESKDAKYTAIVLRIDLETQKIDTIPTPTIKFEK